MGDGTTSIDDLPLSPQTASPNIKLNTKEMQNGNDANSSQDLKKQREGQTADLNQLINGIQQASAAGMTSLPARDIPREHNHITQDRETRANYIPSGPDDYITSHQSHEDIIRKNAEHEKNKDKLDAMYDEFSIPLMIAVLYFVFQMPVLKKNLFKFLPMLFNKDGNPNISGYLVNSVSFGALSYLIMKSVNYLSV